MTDNPPDVQQPDNGTTAQLRATAPPAAEPTARHRIELVVNGQTASAEVESRLLLADFLRHRLALTGTHVGCEQGSCGACTVLVDGQAVRSCLMLAAQVDGREVRTVEGLAGADESLSELQQAFCDQHGLQCGFFTPGCLCSLTVLIERGGAVSEAELDEHLESSFCRCTGYVNIRRAVHQAFGLPVEATNGSGHHE